MPSGKTSSYLKNILITFLFEQPATNNEISEQILIHRVDEILQFVQYGIHIHFALGTCSVVTAVALLAIYRSSLINMNTFPSPYYLSYRYSIIFWPNLTVLGQIVCLHMINGFLYRKINGTAYISKSRLCDYLLLIDESTVIKIRQYIYIRTLPTARGDHRLDETPSPDKGCGHPGRRTPAEWSTGCQPSPWCHVPLRQRKSKAQVTKIKCVNQTNLLIFPLAYFLSTVQKEITSRNHVISTLTIHNNIALEFFKIYNSINWVIL